MGITRIQVPAVRQYSDTLDVTPACKQLTTERLLEIISYYPGTKRLIMNECKRLSADTLNRISQTGLHLSFIDIRGYQQVFYEKIDALSSVMPGIVISCSLPNASKGKSLAIL